MKTYYVIWTYIGNYSTHPIKVEAKDPDDAIKKAVGYYSDDFHKKASIYVFDNPPCLSQFPTSKIA